MWQMYSWRRKSASLEARNQHEKKTVDSSRKYVAEISCNSKFKYPFNTVSLTYKILLLNRHFWRTLETSALYQDADATHPYRTCSRAQFLCCVTVHHALVK